MPAEARTVQRLCLRGPSEEALRRARLGLEDALRTATLPDAGGRVLVVRRLALGRIDPSAGPATIALTLERAMARLRVAFRHGTDAHAGSASAVWFHDTVDAHLALARRLISGPPPDEWFWALAVPRWSRHTRGVGGLRELALSLAELPEAPAALPAWFAGLVRDGHAAALAVALREDEAPGLARAAGLPWGADESDAGGPGRGRAAEGVGRGRARTPALDGTLAREDRPAVRRLLARMLEAAGGPEAGAGEGPHRPSGPWALPGRGRDALDAGPGASDGRPTTGSGGGAGSPPHPEGPPGDPEEDAAHGPAAAGDPESDAPRRDRHRVPDEPGVPNEAAGFPNPVPTAAGGLLFLLNALARLGYPEWLAREPAWAGREVARRVLARALERMEIPREDPAWTVAETGPLSTRIPRSFVAPRRWRDGLLAERGPLRLAATDARGRRVREGGRLYDPSGRLLLGGWRGPRPRALLADVRRASPLPTSPGPGTPRALDLDVVEAWGVALRRWLPRFAGIGLRDLVLRPAALSVTRVHLDVWLDPSDADLRIRRAGLDLDPGWLPWLGRVVAFHYAPTSHGRRVLPDRPAPHQGRRMRE